MKEDNGEMIGIKSEDAQVKVIYEYCLLRYVADVEREEFVNIGLMMMSKRYRWLRSAVLLSENRIEGFFHSADLPRLRVQASLFERDDVPDAELSVEERYRWMAAVKSAVLQTSPSHPGILILPAGTETAEIRRRLDGKFDELMARLVE